GAPRENLPSVLHDAAARDRARPRDRPPPRGKRRRPYQRRARIGRPRRAVRLALADRRGRAMKYRVLVVDDEEAARYGMRRALETREHLIYEAPDLRSARYVIEHEEPQLVLLDLNLPDGSGLDLLRELKRRPDAPEVIVITAHGSERRAIEAVRSGADEYLSKPFDIDELRLL